MTEFVGYDNYIDFPSITGWQCNSICQVIECHYLTVEPNCTGYYLDLDSNDRIEAITPIFNV